MTWVVPPEISSLIVNLLIAGGGGTAVAFLMLRAFGSRWLDSMFERKSQSLQHEHEQRLEQLRLEGGSRVDKGSRLRAEQFKVLPVLWAHLWRAHKAVMLILPGFRQTPDLSKSTDRAITKYLSGIGFTVEQQEEVIAAEKFDRNRVFLRILSHHENVDARSKVGKASDYLQECALFIDQDLFDEFDKFISKAWSAIIANELIDEARSDRGGVEGIERDDTAYRKNSGDWLKALREKARNTLADGSI